jgi:3-hydroxyacyl-CoA dehydrogenase
MIEEDDMAGLDVAWRVRQERGHFQDAGARRPVAADRLFALGRYGQKTGKGWYRYDEDRKPVADPEVLELIRNESRKAEITQRQFSDEEIVERSFLGMINEGARLLKEGVALRASDIDIIYVNGYGFPAWRGGPMFYADCLGLPHVVARLGALERELGSRWSAAPLLCELADSESSFREFDKSRQV